MSWYDPLLDRVRGRPPIVSVVPLRGVIGSVGLARRGLTAESVAPLLEAAFRPRPVTAVALLVNSPGGSPAQRSEEHTSELQSLMRISYAVFCLQKKTRRKTDTHTESYG